ncbi:MAG TPA: transcriptional regulator [Actinopolymorphaceae bacterium]|jgi:DNA-binding MarR family transcriptional regulator
MTHPRHQLDPVIHNPARFSIMAILVATDRAEFRFVRDTVELSDSSLSQHVTALEQAGYVTVTKGQLGRRPRTWLSATPSGREAFSSHVALLNEIAGSSTREPAAPPG